MTDMLTSLTAGTWLLALAIAALGGVVKGMVGFAMPMILVSGLGMFIAPELALAGLIMPTLVTNGMQAMRQGAAAALASVGRFRVFLGVGLVTLVISAQLVRVLPVGVLLAMIGGPITVFAALQLAGWRPRFRNGPSRGWEIGIGGFAGFIGGMSGVWGPPTVAYLTALDTEKREQIRVQGVIYGLGAVALAVAHVASGVLNARTIWFSLALIPPAVLGMWLGSLVQDRIDQAAFRKATLIVLLIAGLNILRRALT
ncbi:MULTISPECIES: sulfite exporter TauE/SafE family protein [Ponticoccus]|uniref:Probable membrane transporter protein n=1 Tax=Ponticoccus litoralis TaxID=422297 RepID=A0AAW9SMR5_9RHOB